MSKVACLAAIAAALLVSGASAAEPTFSSYLRGESLQRLCEADTASCEMYIVGVVDRMFLDASDQEQRTDFCLPQGVKSGQLRLVVMKYLRDNPEVLHAVAASNIGAAVSIAFPCKPARAQ